MGKKKKYSWRERFYSFLISIFCIAAAVLVVAIVADFKLNTGRKDAVQSTFQTSVTTPEPLTLRAAEATATPETVATATPEPLARACLERLGVLEDFAFLLSCDAVGAGKDKPDVFLEAARRLGAAPAETAVFEDAVFALQTAKDAGFYTVGVWDASGDSRWEEMTALADETLRDWGAAETL